MSKYNNMSLVSLEAGQDLSTKQFFFVAVAADGQIDPAGAGLIAEGVLQDNPSAAGRAAVVAIGGIVKVSAGAATTRGGPVASDANGQAVDAASGDVIMGTFLEAAGALGDIVSILFQPRGAF